MTTDEQPFDSAEMFMAHDLFRRETGLLPDLVRVAPTGDQARAVVVSDHAELVCGLLHHHHHAEDEFIWPLLLERSHEQIAPLVQLMEDQHAAVASIDSQVREAQARWRLSASAPDRAELADRLDLLRRALSDHLSLEEKQVVPVMEQHITLEEWSDVQRKVMGGLDPEMVALALGMMSYEATPEVIDELLHNLPVEQREPLRQASTQAFAEHAQQVHGTATPPRSTEL